MIYFGVRPNNDINRRKNCEITRSICVNNLVKNGYNPIILDNFSTSRRNVIKNLEIITDKKITFFNI